MGIIYNRFERNDKRKNLRNKSTKTEIAVWSQLKGKKLMELKFRRQFSVGPFIVDFYCPELKLALEIDGESHFTKEAIIYDKKREEYIKQFGIHFLRVTNDDVFEDLEAVIGRIGIFACELKAKLR